MGTLSLSPARGKGIINIIVRAGAVLLSFLPLTQSAECPLVTTMSVSSTTEASELSEALLCSGTGNFEVEWSGDVQVSRTIFVSNRTALKVTGVDGGTAGSTAAVIDGGEATQLFVVDDGSTLELNGLSLTGGLSQGSGGAVRVSGSSQITAVDCSFSYNNASSGGAIYAESSDVWIEGESSFLFNTGSGAIHLFFVGNLSIDGETSFLGNQGGAIRTWNWDGNLSRVSIAGNTAFSNNYNDDHGGAIHVLYTALSVDGVTSFTNNSAPRGGAIYMIGGTFLADGITSVVNNVAGDVGGGLYCDEGASLAFNGYTLFEANIQGALWSSNSDGTVTGTTEFVGNTRTGSGGAVYVFFGSFIVEGNILFANNTAEEDGGALYIWQTEAFIGEGLATFSNNSAKGNGGAISTYLDVSLTLGGLTTFAENTAESNGGAVHAVDSSIFTEPDASFLNNKAVTGAGGGVYCSRTVAIFNGTSFTGNSAVWGGGMALFSSGSVWSPGGDDETLGPTNITACDFKNNRADDGGAIYSSAGYDIIENSLFESNFAALSGGAFLHSGVLVGLRNTIFYGNEAGEDGLAIMSLGIVENITDVTFDANTYFCPAGTYGHDVEESDEEVSGTCRFEVVCSRCATSCEDSETLFDTVYLHNASTVPVCRVVPEGVNASGNAGTTLQTLDLESGHYRTSAESENILECYREEACIGEDIAGQYCATGYQGAYCAVCEEGYAPGMQYSCRSCLGDEKRSAIGSAIVLLVVTLLIVGFAVVDLVRVECDSDDAAGQSGERWKKFSSCRERIWKAVPLTAIKTILVVWQIVTQFASVVDVEYPDVYERFLSGLNVVNFNLGFFLSFLCVMEGNNFYGRLLFATLVPLAVLGGLAVTHTVAIRNNQHSRSGMQNATHRHLSIVLFVMFAVYSSVSFTVFQTFVCEKLDNGVEYLRADYSLTCTTNTHTAMEVYAGLMVIVYPLGIPAAFAWWLASNRHALRDRVGTAPPAEHLTPMKDLWEPYKPKRYYYEVLECGRRIILTGLAVFIYPGSAAQVAIEVAFAAALLVVFEVLAPFVDSVDTWLYRSGALVVFFSMYLALLLKVDASDENSESQETFASLLVAAHVGLILMVVVNSLCAVRQTNVLGSLIGKRLEVRDVPMANSYSNNLGRSVADDGDERK